MPVKSVPTTNRDEEDLLRCPPTIPVIQLDGCALTVTLAGEKIRLTRLEYAVFEYLAHRAGQIVKLSELSDNVWKSSWNEGDDLRRVKSCIKRLRAKVESDTKHPQLLLTAHGAGYFMPVFIRTVIALHGPPQLFEN